MSTKIKSEDCVDLIVLIIGGTIKDWKRLSKKNTPEGVERIFENRGSGQTVKVMEEDGAIRIAGATIPTIPEMPDQPWHTLNDFDAFKFNPIKVNFRSLRSLVAFTMLPESQEDDSGRLEFEVSTLKGGKWDEGGEDSEACEDMLKKLFADVKFDIEAETAFSVPIPSKHTADETWSIVKDRLIRSGAKEWIDPATKGKKATAPKTKKDDAFEAFKNNPIKVDYSSVGVEIVYAIVDDENQDEEGLTFMFDVAPLSPGGFLDDGGNNDCETLTRQLFADVQGEYEAETTFGIQVIKGHTMQEMAEVVIERLQRSGLKKWKNPYEGVV